MKKFLLACMLFSQTAMAQWKPSEPLFKLYRFEVPKPMNNPFYLPETFSFSKPLFFNKKDTVIKINPEGFFNGLALAFRPHQFLGKTDQGTVYSISPDNRPCLLPDLSNVERMPVSRYNIYIQDDIYRMPNPLAPKKIHPKNQKKPINK